MELIDQKTKKIMELCKVNARKAGLVFEDETLEYIVTNRDMLELSPKVMIPTLYDYWAFDVDVLKEKGKYNLYPSNPYETVINTRPAISYYNDNNPDWLNVMIFYHVLGHIDFFQNNIFFSHTWDLDFTGRALSDKRLIAEQRKKHGRWVDYVIEFTRSIDNTVGYFTELQRLDKNSRIGNSKIDYYFDVFLQTVVTVSNYEYIKEINRYNELLNEHEGTNIDALFFAVVIKKYSEFESLYMKYIENNKDRSNVKKDLIQFIMEKSEFLNKDKNIWMKSVMQVVRDTSLIFQPQIRTKIMNEGWASYWHEELYMKDKRIKGHEVSFARVNSSVTSMPKIGLNPYALGLRLFHSIKDNSDMGRLSFNFESIRDIHKRKIYDKKTGNGLATIFKVRKEFSDSTFLNKFITQDFIDKNDLFVSGKRLNQDEMVWEYYIKSRNVEDYKKMLSDTLYHPPVINVKEVKEKNNELCLNHKFEGKQLIRDFIKNTMMGIEFLWGGQVSLHTHELEDKPKASTPSLSASKKKEQGKKREFKAVEYRMENKKLIRKQL